MDIIGTVASTVQLLSNAIITFQSIRNLPVRIRAQEKILQDLLGVAESIQENKLLQTITIIDLLKNISDTVEKIQKQLPLTGKAFSRHLQNVKYYFKEADVVALMQSLEPAKSSLIICIANQQILHAERTFDSAEETRRGMDAMHISMFGAPLPAVDKEPSTVSPAYVQLDAIPKLVWTERAY